MRLDSSWMVIVSRALGLGISPFTQNKREIPEKTKFVFCLETLLGLACIQLSTLPGKLNVLPKGNVVSLKDDR